MVRRPGLFFAISRDQAGRKYRHYRQAYEKERNNYQHGYTDWKNVGFLASRIKYAVWYGDKMHQYFLGKGQQQYKDAVLMAQFVDPGLERGGKIRI